MSFFVLALLSTSAPPPPASAVRVAVLLSQESPAYRAALDGFRAQLQEFGFTVQVDSRVMGPADGVATRQLRAWAPQLLLTLGTPAATLAAREFSDLPTVAVVLRRSDLEPLANATGVFLEFSSEVELDWLRRFLPHAKRVGVVYNPAENRATVSRGATSATALGLRLIPRAVESRTQVPDALASLRNQADVLWGVADTLALTPETASSFLLFSFRSRIPFVGLSRAWVKAGALYALDRDWTDVGRQCGELAQRILADHPARSLPPSAPRRIVYYINRNTAESLKLEFPPNLLQAAAEVIR